LIKAEYPQWPVVGLAVGQKDYMLHAMQKASEVVAKENAVIALYAAIRRAVASTKPALIM
jgi:hypothetical protein